MTFARAASPSPPSSRVKLSFGGREVVATVTEDCGNIGGGGRRPVRLRIDPTGEVDAIAFEIPAAGPMIGA
jgi:hypothetical protein